MDYEAITQDKVKSLAQVKINNILCSSYIQ